MDFLCELGRRITQCTDDHRESAFLFQRLSVLIQRYNAVAVLGTFAVPYNPRGRIVAVPAFVLVFSWVFHHRNLYYRARKAAVLVGAKNKIKKIIIITVRRFTRRIDMARVITRALISNALTVHEKQK